MSLEERNKAELAGFAQSLSRNELGRRGIDLLPQILTRVQPLSQVNRQRLLYFLLLSYATRQLIVRLLTSKDDAGQLLFRDVAGQRIIDILGQARADILRIPTFDRWAYITPKEIGRLVWAMGPDSTWNDIMKVTYADLKQYIFQASTFSTYIVREMLYSSTLDAKDVYDLARRWPNETFWELPSASENVLDMMPYRYVTDALWLQRSMNRALRAAVGRNLTNYILDAT